MTNKQQKQLPKVAQLIYFYFLCIKKKDVVTYGDYYDTFMKTLSPAERKKNTLHS